MLRIIKDGPFSGLTLLPPYPSQICSTFSSISCRERRQPLTPNGPPKAVLQHLRQQVQQTPVQDSFRLRKVEYPTHNSITWPRQTMDPSASIPWLRNQIIDLSKR